MVYSTSGSKNKTQRRHRKDKNKHYRKSSGHAWTLVDDKSEFEDRLRDSSYSFFDKWDEILRSE